MSTSTEPQIEKEPKMSSPPPETTPDDNSGHVTGEILLDSNGFKLFPQPVLGDDLDPLNWTTFRKHTILAIVMSL